MRTLTIHLGTHRDACGLSLRGSCLTAADAGHLDQALDQLLLRHPTQIWIDCQQLHALTWHGQRALLQADTRSRAAGATLYWCGLAGSLLAQLASSGVHTVLHLLPAADFNGPRFLLPDLTPPPAAQLSW